MAGRAFAHTASGRPARPSKRGARLTPTQTRRRFLGSPRAPHALHARGPAVASITRTSARCSQLHPPPPRASRSICTRLEALCMQRGRAKASALAGWRSPASFGPSNGSLTGRRADRILGKQRRRFVRRSSSSSRDEWPPPLITMINRSGKCIRVASASSQQSADYSALLGARDLYGQKEKKEGNKY